jgi:hypothetical protein
VADALTAEQVAQVVSYIAPGFIAWKAYAARVPQPEPSEFALLVRSVVLSLPIVAITNALARALDVDTKRVTTLSYVLLLLVVAAVLGTAVGALRMSARTRSVLGFLRLPYQPESSVYSYLLRLPPTAVVTVQLKDGSKVSGTPAAGPDVTGTTGELMLTNPAWWDSNAELWQTEGAGGAVIVALEQIRTVTLDRSPL